MGKFGRDAAVQIAEVEREQPSRPANVVSDVAVPLLQSAITGAVGSGLLTWLLHEAVPQYSGDFGEFFAFWWLCLGSFVWVALLVDTRRLLRVVERLVGRDLDGDGTVGERVVVVGAAAAQRDAAVREQQARQSQFRDFVTRLPTLGTGYSVWESRLGRDMYLEFRDALLRLGYARWNSRGEDGTPNVKQGWSLAVPVSEVLGRVMDAD